MDIKLLLKIYSFYCLIPFIKSSNCNISSVTSDSVVYNGCKESVGLESLGNGSISNITIFTFKGIPYATPPLGSLRFARPIPYNTSSNSSIDASNYGHSCIQLPFISTQMTDTTDQSEDCLTLNIWSPNLNKTANLTVMFFIPGGAFLWGSSKYFDGKTLSVRQVVVVHMNYRLGAFGFLSGDQDDAPGNQGIWDQIMALNWTKKHIRDFGGNPDDITIFAHSAGSMALSYLVLSDVSKNMFQRAILQSGSGFNKIFSKDKTSATKMAKDFAANSTLFVTGCCNGSDWINCLRRKDKSEILAAQSLALQWNFFSNDPWYAAYLLQFGPIYGDDLMPTTLNKSIEQGNFRSDMRILIGHTEMEGELFARLFDLVRLMGFLYQAEIPDVPYPIINNYKVYNDIKYDFIDVNTFGSLVAQKYTETFDNTSLIRIVSNLIPSFINQNAEINRNRLRSSAVHALGDFLLTCPTILFGNYLAKKDINVYQYRLTYISKKAICYGSAWCNVTHFDDCPLIFGFPFQTPQDYSDTDREVSIQIMNIWTQFAKNGTLSKLNGFDWLPYSVETNGETNLKYMILDVMNKTRFVTNGYDEIDGFTPSVIMNCKKFWDKLLFEQF